ncbi:MAG: FecR domain-containing protein [Deltaproteobacteria bacterium]|nr:FecR domain-containing protein [Deltaproteobacteria bacterium]
MALYAAIALGACGWCGHGPEAVIENVTPKVTLSRGTTEPELIDSGTRARAGDTITTDEAGAASLKFPGGSVLKLAPSTSVYLESGPRGLRAHQVRLLFGSLDAVGANRELVVMTMVGAIEFGGDRTEASISANEQGLSVRTLIGEVTIGDQVVGAGISVRVDSNGIVFETPDGGAAEDAAGPAAPGEAVLLSLKSGRGAVRQVGGKGRFSAVKPGTQLAPSDVLEARGAAAVVDLGGLGEARIWIRSGIAVGSGDSGGSSPSFETRRGTAQVLLDGGMRQSVAIGAARALVLASARGSDVEFTTDARGTRIRVYEGRVQITDADGARHELWANQEAAVTATGRSQVRDRETSALKINPTVRRVLVAGRMPAVTFIWSQLEGEGPYTIEVARDADFANKLIVTDVPDTSFVTDRLQSGTYWWRVRNATKSIPARAVSFGVDRVTGEADLRKNVVNASGERTVVLYQQYQPPELTFRWTAAANADSYRIDIWPDGKFDQPVFEQVVGEPQVKVASGTLKDGRYLWAVTVLDASGKNLSTSDMYDLTVKFDSNEMLLRIFEPRAGARVRGNTVETRGMAAPGAEISVNGKNVKPDEAGRFKATVPVVGSPPLVIYRMGGNIFVRALRR